MHAAGLAARPPALSPSKVLLLPLGRLRLGTLGLAEALAGDVSLVGEELLQAQRDDVTVRDYVWVLFEGYPVSGCLNVVCHTAATDIDVWM